MENCPTAEQADEEHFAFCSSTGGIFLNSLYHLFHFISLQCFLWFPVLLLFCSGPLLARKLVLMFFPNITSWKYEMNANQSFAHTQRDESGFDQLMLFSEYEVLGHFCWLHKIIKACGEGFLLFGVFLLAVSNSKEKHH